MKTATKLSLIAAVALSISTPVFAQTAGDYYAPTNTVEQQASPAEQNEIRQGDYYASEKTSVQAPSAQAIYDDAQGDFYAPNN